MAKSGNFNVNVDEKVAKVFNEWSGKTPGKKYEHITGALNAIQAIYGINKTLAITLMNSDLSAENAIDLVKRAIIVSWMRGWVDFPSEKDLPINKPEIKITSPQQNVEAVKKTIKMFLKMNTKDYNEAAKYLDEDEQKFFDEWRKFKGSKGQKKQKEKMA